MCELLGLIVVGLVQTGPNTWFLQGWDVETGELVLTGWQAARNPLYPPLCPGFVQFSGLDRSNPLLSLGFAACVPAVKTDTLDWTGQ
jgi:hypothetical protein